MSINLTKINNLLNDKIYNNNPTPNGSNMAPITNIINELIKYPYTYENRYYVHKIIQKVLNRRKIGKQGILIIMNICDKINGTITYNQSVNGSFYLLLSTIAYIFNKMWLLGNTKDKHKKELCAKLNEFIKSSSVLKVPRSETNPNFFTHILLKCNDGTMPSGSDKSSSNKFTASHPNNESNKSSSNKSTASHPNNESNKGSNKSSSDKSTFSQANNESSKAGKHNPLPKSHLSGLSSLLPKSLQSTTKSKEPN
jgi:hypothetical protein